MYLKRYVSYVFFFVILGIMLLYSVNTAYAAESFVSYHQTYRTINYCSTSSCSNAGLINCKAGEKQCAESIKGFRDIYNINDPRIYCYGQTSCTLSDDDYLTLNSDLDNTTLSDTIKIYIPAGAVKSAIGLYGMATSGQIATVARFGTPPDCTIPKNYADVPNNTSGATISQLKESCQFSRNGGGSISVTNINHYPMVTTGGWLYIKILHYDANRVSGYKFSLVFKVKDYKTWYNSVVWPADGDPPDQILSISPTNQDVIKVAGTTAYTVSNTGLGTMPWTAAVTDGASWFRITSGASGSNAGTIACAYDANTGASLRTGKITVTASGAVGSPKEVTVTQAGTLALSVSPAKQNVLKDAGTSTFNVSNSGTGTMGWKAEVTSGTWLSIKSGASGTNSGTITCAFTANPGGTERTGTIRVTAVGAVGSPMDVTVTQAPVPTQPILSVLPPQQNVSKDAGTTTFAVSNTGINTMAWTAAVTSGGTWLSIKSGASGSNSGTITCAFTVNTGTARTGTLRVTATGASGSPKDVTVIQAGTPRLSVTPDNQDVLQDGKMKDGNSPAFEVTNTGDGIMPWTAAVKTGGDWLRITSGASGTNKGTIMCEVDLNKTKLLRTGTIQVTATGAGGSRNVTVTQAPVLVLVPDTGLTKCYDSYGEEITCPGEGEPYFGQDANYDINLMSYTKLDASGIDLPDTAESWAMVKDNVTGLIWEVKTTDGSIHDAVNTYSWYDSNPTTNGGYPGAKGTTGSDTESFIAKLNTDKFGGFVDWRIPTIRELHSIVNYNYNQPKPTIDTKFFPNIKSALYLTSTTAASNPLDAWGVFFSIGYIRETLKENKNYVIAISGGQTVATGSSSLELIESPDNAFRENATAPVAHYIDNGNKTITDTSTGLMWQQESLSNRNWEQSLSDCTGLNLGGYTDWRLPTHKELIMLADYSRVHPAIYTEFFTASNYFWTATSYVDDARQAWVVDFDDGNNTLFFKNVGINVRAVRNVLNLSVNPKNTDATAQKGDAQFEVSTSGSGKTIKWTASSDSGWLTIKSGSAGIGNGIIQCEYTANDSSTTRTGKIRVVADDSNLSPIDVVLTQKSAARFLGAWADGVWSWCQPMTTWTKINDTSNAQMITAGKVDGDDYDDLIGVWSTGLYVLQSSNNQWVNLSATLPTWITVGDLNNDGRDDVIGSWKGDGVYSRDSASGKWTKLTSPAMQLATGNIGGVRDDLVGVWDTGLWVRNSANASWSKIDTTIPVWIAAGDMSGDSRADIIGSYTTTGINITTIGTWYRNSATGAWSRITTPAEQLSTGDIDGDGRDDLIGIWSNIVYVKYGTKDGITGMWEQISSTKPKWITTGRIKPKM